MGKLNVLKNFMNANNKKIVKFNGGLGNQMFQYAFAYALAKNFNLRTTLDFSWFEDVKTHENVTSRQFELDVFNVECDVATKEDLTKINRPEFKSKLKNILAKIFPQKFGVNYVSEKYVFCYDKKLVNSPAYYYYEGYFQNEKYFKHLRTELLNRFSLRVPLDEKNQAVLNKILETNSVSLHVRRGDYVSLDFVNKFHGLCSLDYYQNAVEYIAKKVNNPHFFIFSDDIEWVIKNLKIDYPFTIVDFNQNKGCFDMNLMKNCKHNIIANSSFSWWGAWLNNNPNKIVVAPKNWVAINRNCSIIPKNWIKI
jgi:hypothetical protein